MLFQRWRCLPWIAALGALIAIGGCGSPQSRFQSHLQRGEDYLKSGSLDKASVELRNALQIRPRDAHARYLYGRVSERRGNLAEAVNAYSTAVELDPEATAARAALSHLYVLGGAPERAVALLEPSLAGHPHDPALLLARAGARARLGDLSGAVADAEHAVGVAPEDDDAVALLAALYQRQGNSERATQLLAEAVGKRPASIDLRQALASQYLASGQNSLCEAQLQQIIRLAPRELPRRYLLATFYNRTHDINAAQRVLEAAVADFPTDVSVKLTLADFLSRERSHEQGADVLRDFLRHDPKNDELRLGLATLLQRDGAPEQAMASYKEVVEHDSTSAAALVARDRMAALEIVRGHAGAARDLVDAALMQSPRDADALMMRAQLALQSHDPAAAVADLRAVLRDNPNAREAQRALARAYYANGDGTLAEETLRAALQRAPADIALRLELGQLLAQLGKRQDTVTLIEETARAAPREPGVREALIRAYLAAGDLPAARAAAQELKGMQPEAAGAYYLAGLVAQQQDRLEDARREFERALSLKPGAVDVLTALTRLQLGHDQAPLAIARLRTILGSDPKNVPVANLLGEALLATRSYPEAIAVLTAAITLAPRWAPPYHNLAMAHLRGGDPIQAETAYRAGLAQMPFEPALTSGLAELYVRQGHVDQAIALYDALRTHDPHLQLARNNLAMLLVTYRTDPASLDKARDLTADFADSDNAALLDTHGWVRLKLGELSAALSSLGRAADRAPDLKVVRYHLAVAELKAGEPDKARSNLQVALAGSGTFDGSADAQATLDRLIANNRG